MEIPEIKNRGKKKLSVDVLFPLLSKKENS
jgi:hypothetical protein